jgi:hypothetical protein
MIISMKIRVVIAAIGTAALLAGCGGAAHPAGPPKAAALAAKLGCHVTGNVSDPQWAYDAMQYVSIDGGPCAENGAINETGNLAIITFPSQAKETDWLHQNAAAENSTFPDGYFEVVAGHLWIVASGGVMGGSFVVSKLGGKDTTF